MAPPYQMRSVWGNSIQGDNIFETLTGLTYCPNSLRFSVIAHFRCIFWAAYIAESVSPIGDDSIALLCDTSGQLWLAGCQSTIGATHHYNINNASGVVYLQGSPVMVTPT